MNKAISSNPDDAENHHVLAEVYSLQAEMQQTQKQPAEDTLTKGLQAIQKSIFISQNDADSYLLQVHLQLLLANEQAEHGQSPLPTLQQAHGAAVRARDVNAKSSMIYLRLGQIALAGAEWLLSHRKPADKEIIDGQSSIDEALALNPKLALALATRGSLYLLAARSAAPGLQRRLLAEHAVLAIKQALTLSPMLARQYDGRLSEAVQMSASLTAAERLLLGTVERPKRPAGGEAAGELQRGKVGSGAQEGKVPTGSPGKGPDALPVPPGVGATASPAEDAAAKGAAKKDKKDANKGNAPREATGDGSAAPSGTTPEAKTEAKTDIKAHAKTEVQTEAKPETKTEAKSDTKAEAKPAASDPSSNPTTP